MAVDSYNSILYVTCQYLNSETYIIYKNDLASNILYFEKIGSVQSFIKAESDQSTSKYVPLIKNMNTGDYDSTNESRLYVAGSFAEIYDKNDQLISKTKGLVFYDNNANTWVSIMNQTNVDATFQLHPDDNQIGIGNVHVTKTDSPSSCYTGCPTD